MSLQWKKKKYDEYSFKCGIFKAIVYEWMEDSWDWLFYCSLQDGTALSGSARSKEKAQQKVEQYLMDIYTQMGKVLED